MKQKGRKKIINNLHGKVSEMSNELEALKESVEQQQQYSRRNCNLIHRITDQKGKDTDQQALKIRTSVDQL